ncbi:MAG: uracil-DNA glycosylase [Clostridiales bacterium]|nr:MAG: uracil-DNA glycosylase [Clostridiales bacterium]
MINLGNDWDELLKDEFEKPYYKNLREFLKKEYKTSIIHPDMYDIFNALKTTAYKDVKAVIIGQDPYHGTGQAHGMCFSVKKGVPKPPSLINIFKELQSDLGIKEPSDGFLEPWAKQGVLLLNAVLTVRDGAANSHRGMGWETFTDAVIQKINEKQEPVVFLLWGAYAREKAKTVTNKNHLLLTAAHPSPLSAYNGFLGCKHFSKANEFLRENGRGEINWDIASAD